ncbi:nitrile hydratase accessory protein [Minwuia sp.]|uniref:nitrile hydratase accessory protein n=1 Tax=Minwuia sp. TaxID=2493630 RepID=UPI003A925026
MTAAPEDLPGIPKDSEGPTFREPWEAEAFALAVRLHEAGHFGWDEWAATLSDEIKAAQAAGDADLGDTYYHHWLAALERLCREKGLASTSAVKERKAAWREAYLATPHGQPVELK